MKRISFFSLLAIGVLVLLSGCTEDKPQALFSYSNDGLRVEFTNYSSNATSYSWSFGDGYSSSETNPVHTYASSGSYTVTLTASDYDGHSDTYSKTIYVYKNSEPVEVIISQIVLNKFPAAPSSGSWDIAGKPDVYITIEDANYNELYKSTTYEDINNSSLPKTYSVYYSITNLSSYYWINVYDEDVIDDDELMGYVSWAPYQYTSTEPTSCNLSNSANDLDLTLKLSWYDAKGEEMYSKDARIVNGVVLSNDIEVLEALRVK